MSEEQVPVLNYEAALLRVGSDKELYLEILEVFLEDVPGQLKKLVEAVESGDVEVAQRQAHSLKSAAANIGAEAMSKVAYGLESAVADEGLGGVSERVASLHTAFATVVEELAVCGLRP